jgi:acylphosphatase
VVQGVGFRYFVRDVAGGAGLAGWVRNRADGAVEVLAQGPRPELDRLVDALREGPPWAEVTAVEVDWGPAGTDLDEFRVVG